MLRICLMLARLFRAEPISIQREILNRLAKKRPQLDHSSAELLELYEHANELIKGRRTKSIPWAGVKFLMEHPKTSLNLLNSKKVPVEELERYRTMIKVTKS